MRSGNVKHHFSHVQQVHTTPQVTMQADWYNIPRAAVECQRNKSLQAKTVQLILASKDA